MLDPGGSDTMRSPAQSLLGSSAIAAALSTP
jgi:hypothetical protein